MSTGPLDETVTQVLIRDFYSCIRCKKPIQGQRGLNWSIHHRRPRRMGGTRRPDTNLNANLVTVCGHGTSGCHEYIESNGIEAIAKGWKLHDNAHPDKEPILWFGRLVILTNTPYTAPTDVTPQDPRTALQDQGTGSAPPHEQ